MPDNIKITIGADDKSAAVLQAASRNLKNMQIEAEGVKARLELMRTAVSGVVSALAGFGVSVGFSSLIKDATLVAARVETLGIVLDKVGANAGFSSEQVAAYAEGVRGMGITVEESRSTVIRMIQSQLDLNKATDLARLSQDAAVIANINSSEALQRLIHGITTLQPEVLRTMGIVVNFEAEYKKFAVSVGRTVESLTAQEKQQIALSAALEQGAGIAGVYEAALGTVSKQLSSLPRLANEAQVGLGSIFTPALSMVITDVTESLKGIGDFFKNNEAQAKEWAATLVHVFSSIKAEGLRLGAVFDKVGGTLTSAGMLLYGPGRMIGNENSTKQFEKMADWNMMYEKLFNEKDAALQKLADNEFAMIQKIYSSGGAGNTNNALLARFRSGNEDDAKLLSVRFQNPLKATGKTANGTKSIEDAYRKEAQEARDLLKIKDDLWDWQEKYAAAVAKDSENTIAIEQKEADEINRIRRDLYAWDESRLKKQVKDFEQSAGQMVQFYKSAADGMQRAMSDGFFDILEGRATSFSETMTHMTNKILADMLAAQASFALFGDYGKTGKLEGLAGSAMSSIGSYIGGMMGFATGGSFVVPGGGGTDSVIAPIRVTPGEKVTVGSNNAAPAGDTIVVNYAPNINAIDTGAGLQFLAGHSQAIVGIVNQAVLRLGRRGIV